DREAPLVLAATGRLAAIFKQHCSYANLLPDSIADSPDRLSEGEFAERARPVLDKAYAGKIDAMRGLYEQRKGEDRTTTDIADAARAASFGAIDTLLADIDSVVPGSVDDETGSV